MMKKDTLNIEAILDDIEKNLTEVSLAIRLTVQQALIAKVLDQNVLTGLTACLSRAHSNLEKGFGRATSHEDVKAALTKFNDDLKNCSTTSRQCPVCEGIGSVNGDECSHCHGKGYIVPIWDN